MGHPSGGASKLPGKHETARRPGLMAGLAALATALVVFIVALIVFRRFEARDHPLSAASNSPSAASITGPASSSPPPASPALDLGANSPLQVYWRFGTAQYFNEHPRVSRSEIQMPDGCSASLVRVDVENQGAKAVPIQPGAFILSGPEVTVFPSQGLPGLMAPRAVAAHGSIQGWLLFVKPWLDFPPDGQPVIAQIQYVAPPYAHVGLSTLPRKLGP